MEGYVEGTCGTCGEQIQDAYINAFGMQWHLDHLQCNVCGKDFSDGTQVCEGHDGFAYCPDDWKKTFLPPCGGCQKPINGPTINALNKTWHPDCFVCGTCKAKLTGQFFPGSKGLPLCEKHYYDEQNLICGGCNMPIVAGKCITMKGDDKGQRDIKFHVEHFKLSLIHI
eukprot:TRINITY_DN1213_c0_g1_i1.p1 TRINITY_DN1213_c0_g1~~TRINITY_DN1213_c0_g1_i1.p1  ORF type:complete len:169 (-),score=19.47 TRINITY_DN1213_c0_g1_i1:24-530(-)